VFGNPPYVRMEGFAPIKNYLKEHYSAHEERADFYTYFIEKAIDLINDSGLIGMIISNKFSVAKYGKPLRETIKQKAVIREITDFAGARVFKGATVRTFILFLGHPSTQKDIEARYIPVPSRHEFNQIERGVLSVSNYANHAGVILASNQLTASPWQLISATQSNLLNRLNNDFPTLRQAFAWTPLFGIKTGLNEAFIIDDNTRKKLIAEDKSSADALRPILFGKDVKPYEIYNENRYVIYLNPNKDIDKYPALKKHLEAFRSKLNNRAASQKWYELQQPATSLIPLLEKPKIVYPIIAPEPRFTLDNKGFLINDKLFVLPTDSLFLLGILNSSLADFFFSSNCARLEGSGETYYEFRAQFVERFPIRPINFSDPAEKAMYDKIASLVERMLALHKRRPRTPQEQEMVKREIESTDSQIDRLVYELYGLTEEEIKIVEGG
jgi:Eco57I restriction-modification methylase/restriction endonuclease TaqI-like protein/restriction-modification enzyme MmeI-like protein